MIGRLSLFGSSSLRWKGNLSLNNVKTSFKCNNSIKNGPKMSLLNRNDSFSLISKEMNSNCRLYVSFGKPTNKPVSFGRGDNVNKDDNRSLEVEEGETEQEEDEFGSHGFEKKKQISNKNKDKDGDKKIGADWWPRNMEIPVKNDYEIIRLVSEVELEEGDVLKRDRYVDDVDSVAHLSDESFIREYKPMKEVSKLIPFGKALKMARECKLDLIGVGKDAQGSFICRAEAFSYFMKELRNKERKKKKGNTRLQKIKEIMISVNIADHDLATKTNAIRRVLSKGDQARVVISFAKKEVPDLRLANGILDLILVHVQDLGRRDSAELKPTPKPSGDFVSCYYFPIKSRSSLVAQKEQFAEDREGKKKKMRRGKENKMGKKGEEEGEEDDGIDLDLDLDDDIAKEK
eukprot:TRINITY_DN8995_c0_g1_i1.p1 TRINITY_DN8995_c0_g1~~TRINITY_DN8995_c0_g1_i1.p1  ORF type:complete len:403 (+),score=178.79 TRINITY_DN8995_c0_g1_i1:126-1334(+)